ncbi:hypothetical protein DPMN_017831 [Dreissena polymorpha]|uniref:Uncharacterized protein n=1 Tax=Dreissena polymorpha TaxID=45954 RepID=A0A9D4NG50_DREPO|nr:hypothetical protein DPMN_017831 [Dreissena polymorpha]
MANMRRLNSKVKVALTGDDANDSPVEDMTVTVVQNLAQPEFHQHSDMHTTSKTYQEDDAKEEDKDAFYDALQSVLEDIPQQDMLMLLGDFNA